MARRMKAAAETGDINGLYDSIKEDPNVLDSIDAIPFVDTPLHTAASAGHTDFAVEILRLKPSFGRKLNPEGLSSLHLALINHKFDTVKRLIKLDKELIRVKGKQGETPLHFIARKEDINADQQQRVLDDHHVNADQQQNVLDQQQRELDDHRVNTLADFLFACPNSIDDLTNQDETALHIAVKTKNKSAVEIILGLIRRINKKRLVANKDDKGNTALHLAVKNSQLELVKLLVKESFADRNAKNSETQTALDIALLLEQSDEARSIVNTLRRAGALGSSSSATNDYSLAKFLNSPAGCFEVVYKLKFFMDREVPMELGTIGLVVAVLIATATFTAILSPPGGIGGGGNDLLSNGGNVNATVSSTNNLFGANTSFINATLSIPTDNPADTYGSAFLYFYVLNTCAFVLSMAVIMFVLPISNNLFALLHGALLFMMIAYGCSFRLISPFHGYSEIFFNVSYLCAILVYFCNFMANAIGVVDNRTRSRILFASELQKKRLMMLKRLLDNMEE
ncbi:ankyrin repeat-containing protein BDA1-like [Rhododendron vialii]|uniref:ankyrin repeat-containing protein BDA1-like n=1 Tax=Rhododendron vialii TaxID=182163 RepID=UPI00265DE55A|nr:ankyrin repeat-containing protein BDA1-like [Rhododendron vialii]